VSAMKSTDLIERILQAHDVSLVITDPRGHETHVAVAVPDLTSAPRRVWGDWGPMYAIALPADGTVAVAVGSDQKPARSYEELDARWLEIESPMVATVRAATPLVMNVPLPHRPLVLRVFYDLLARPVRAEVESTVETDGIDGGEALYDVAVVREPAPPVARLEQPRTQQRHHAGEGSRHASE